MDPFPKRFLVLLVTLGVATYHVQAGLLREKRQSDLECAPTQTKVETDYLLTDTESCGDLIQQVVDDWYEPAYREECARWMVTAVVPAKVASTYVSACHEFTNGTVKYKTKICCEGTVNTDNRVCFTCTDDSVLYDAQAKDRHSRHCNHYGTGPEICSPGDVCAVVNTYTSQSWTWGHVTKSCMPSVDCEALKAENDQYCKDSPDPRCVYCYDCDYCNYAHPVNKLRVINATHICYTSSPCGSSGACIPDGESYTCDCNPGSFGPTCRDNACTSRPCKNGGRCNVRSSEPYFYCNCRIQWTGPTCEIPASLCDISMCLNGGTCYHTEEDRCLCPAGFVGRVCEYERPLDCGEDTNKRTITLTRNRNYDTRDCTYLNDVLVQSWLPVFRDQCITHLTNQYSPEDGKFVFGVNGEYNGQQSVGALTCERGNDYTWMKVQVCCASCLSNPCQNGGWCVQEEGSEAFVCRCRYNYGGYLCQSRLASCFSAGDPHYYTFDGAHYHFQGLCKYTMTENLEATDLPYFRVTTKNEFRGTSTTVTYPKYVEVEVSGHIIRLDKGGVVKIDGLDVTNQLPYSDPGGTFIVSMNGLKMRLETEFGLVVEFDGDWLINVRVPPEASGKVDGLCRDYDGDVTNEYVLPNGTDVTNHPSGYAAVGNFFQIPDPEDPEDSECQPWNGTNPPECTGDLAATIESNEYCGQIENLAGPFQQCVVSIGEGTVAMYMVNCFYDVCAASVDGTGAMKNAACLSLKSFTAICQDRNYLPVDADWRTVTNCEIDCLGDLVFKSSAPACNPTCERPTYPEECPFGETENCVCEDSSYVVTEGNLCVPATTCGCVDVGRNIGDVWMNDDCTERSECVECTECVRPVGKVITESVSCEATEICQVVSGQPQCIDVNECLQPPVCDHHCTDLIGGYSCSCDDGYELDEDGRTCNDINECAGDHPCNCGGLEGCTASCHNNNGSFTCGCSTGFTISDDGQTCKDIDECAGDHPCNCGGFEGCTASCHNNNGSFTCGCSIGFTISDDGTTCKDIDECAGDHPCNCGGFEGCTASCHNNNGSFTCGCSTGFTISDDGQTCKDIDECSGDNSCSCGGLQGCSPSCHNNDGSYTCDCSIGFTISYDGTTCKDIDECAGVHPCNCGGFEGCTASCHNNNGSFTCGCSTGFTISDDGIMCKDIDECAGDHPCNCGDLEGCTASCHNNNGSFTCGCSTGFTISDDGQTCKDIDECSGDNSCSCGGLQGCSPSCHNNDGSYTCDCSIGFTISDDGTTCKDIDECAGVHPCNCGGFEGCTASCHNNNGSFTCGCSTGFTISDDGTTCKDIDECSGDNSCSCGGLQGCSPSCHNNDGSYTCDCSIGFTIRDDGTTCKDIDECAGDHPCNCGGLQGCSAFCDNNVGSFTCRCPTGYTLGDDGETCIGNQGEWGPWAPINPTSPCLCECDSDELPCDTVPAGELCSNPGEWGPWMPIGPSSPCMCGCSSDEMPCDTFTAEELCTTVDGEWGPWKPIDPSSPCMCGCSADSKACDTFPADELCATLDPNRSSKSTKESKSMTSSNRDVSKEVSRSTSNASQRSRSRAR